ncbi:MAG: hypothetical protein RLZ12_972 [Bacillota bacterium]|jgi:hypothetical protein
MEILFIIISDKERMCVAGMSIACISKMLLGANLGFAILSSVCGAVSHLDVSQPAEDENCVFYATVASAAHFSPRLIRTVLKNNRGCVETEWHSITTHTGAVNRAGEIVPVFTGAKDLVSQTVPQGRITPWPTALIQSYPRSTSETLPNFMFVTGRIAGPGTEFATFTTEPTNTAEISEFVKSDSHSPVAIVVSRGGTTQVHGLARGHAYAVVKNRTGAIISDAGFVTAYDPQTQVTHEVDLTQHGLRLDVARKRIEPAPSSASSPGSSSPGSVVSGQSSPPSGAGKRPREEEQSQIVKRPGSSSATWICRCGNYNQGPNCVRCGVLKQ